MQSLLNRLKTVLRGRNAYIVLVAASYMFFVFVSMAPSVLNCNDTLSGIGDNTGGPIWRQSLTPEQPLLGGYQQKTNYPFGENLYSPIGYAAYLQTVMINGLSELAGPVCAYNLFNVGGFLSSALIMCAFVYYLTRRKWIAWLSGYAVAFTPYVQSKVGGHPSYGYVSLLILLLWALLLVLQKQKYKYGVFLGVILAACGYFDPYFILFSITILVPSLIFWFGYSIYNVKFNRQSTKKILNTIKVLTLALVVTLAFLSPIIYIRLSKSAEINSTTSSIRGDILAAAQLCSNLPTDYILPDPYNLAYTKMLGQEFTAKNISLRNWCGPGESRVAISLSMILTIFIALAAYIVMRQKNKGKPLKLKIVNGQVLFLGIFISIALAALLLGLPPKILGVPMPSWFVIRLTEMWRIFAREYLVLNMAVVLLFAFSLSFLGSTIFKNRKKLGAVLFALIALLIFVEYQFHDPFRPFTFSYKRDVPTIYKDIKDDDSVTAVAEYPLDRLGIESDSIVYYTTMQVLHNKPILNSSIALNPNEKLHNSIKDLSDPQTIPVLRTLGVSHITVHGITPEELLAKTNQLEIIKVETPIVYGLTMIRSAPTNTIIFAKLKDGPKQGAAVIVDEGFAVNLNIMKNPVTMEYELLPDPLLRLIDIDQNKTAGRACFDIKMSSEADAGNVNILVNGEKIITRQIDSTYSRFTFLVNEGDSIQLDVEPNRNTRINNLGCDSE